jgi:hypothetical protein
VPAVPAPFARLVRAVGAHPLPILAALYVVVRGVALLGVEPRSFPDTGVYDHVAAAPLTSREFWAGWGGWTTPLLFKVVPSPEARMVAQATISTAAWLALAAALMRVLATPAVGVAAFAAVLAFGLGSEIVQWDSAMLTESLAISLTAGVVAACLAVVHRPTPGAAAVAIGLLALWTFTRDPHPYVLVLLAAGLAGSLLARPGRRRRAWALAGVSAIAVAGLASLSLAPADRWGRSLQGVVTLRVTADPVALEYFRARGMPAGPRLLAVSRRARLAGTGDPLPNPGRGAPEWRDFHRWLLRRGRSTYTGYLLSHPAAMAAPLGDLRAILLHPEVGAYRSQGSPRPLWPLADAVNPRDPVRPVVYVAGAVLLALLAAARGGARREWAVPAALIALSLPVGCFVWLANPAEIDRHAFLSGLSLRLGSLMLAMMALDALRARRRPPRASAPDHPPP